MALKTIPLQLNEKAVEISIGSTINREELYGKTQKSVEKDGTLLEKVTLSPEGEVFLSSDFTHLKVDGDGSLAEKPLAQTSEGVPLETQVSSFKERRTIEAATPTELAALKVQSVIPATTDFPVGLYKTQYTYRDSPTLNTAILNVTPEGAFLLVGETFETPFVGKTTTYDFFTDDEDESEEEEEMSFDMF